MAISQIVRSLDDQKPLQDGDLIVVELKAERALAH